AYGVAVGGFLAAMGLGAYLSRFIGTEEARAQAGAEELEPLGSDASRIDSPKNLLVAFAWVELWIAPLSALLPLALFALFVMDGPVWIGLALVTLLLGTLAGLEVPLLTRLLEQDAGVRDALAGVLALDYFGALAGSLALPVLLLPTVGMFPSAALIGALPALMVFLLGQGFGGGKRGVLRSQQRWALLLCAALVALAPMTVPLSDRLENTLYSAPVISRVQSPYQRLVLTRQGQDVRLFLDGELQFSTLDEYRYHEALVHPAMSASASRRRILVMGAGDGLALREVLKWPEVERVLLLELDSAVVNLAQRQPFLQQANAHAYADPRVEVRQADAFLAAPALAETFDVILADFPDPDQTVLAKLYSQGFYRRLLPRLAPAGVFVTQASSPFFAPRAFACIAATLGSVGLSVHPYTVDVPSFGPWGFVLAQRLPLQPAALELPVPTRFLTQSLLHNLFDLPGDVQLGNVEVNRLADPVLVQYQADPRWAAY
ncbi:MAG TPA: polyamine aminopropyltransferase, partial [Trichocoleus sp.]